MRGAVFFFKLYVSFVMLSIWNTRSSLVLSRFVNSEMPYVYILISKKDRRYYIGSTSNYSVRLTLHNAGKVKSTKFYRPWQLVYSEEFDTLSEAVKRERQIKGWKSRASIERLINGISEF